MKRFYRPDEVAEILQINRRTVYRLLKIGRLTGVKNGPENRNGLVRITKESLEAFVEHGTRQRMHGEGF